MATLRVIVSTSNVKLTNLKTSVLYDRTLTNVDLDSFPYSCVSLSLHILYNNVPHRIIFETVYI